MGETLVGGVAVVTSGDAVVAVERRDGPSNEKPSNMMVDSEDLQEHLTATVVKYFRLRSSPSAIRRCAIMVIQVGASTVDRHVCWVE